jgi:glycosyltransferase involved in cell wall biosynthesis
MRVAIVHYWLVGMRGGEAVLETLLEMYPEADIFTHVYDQDTVSAHINSRKIVTTFINRLPFSRKYYKYYLPLMPIALEQLDLTDYDLVISCESGPSKGIITKPEALHVCYCFSPMRYIWDLTGFYQRDKNWFIKLLLMPVIHYLRIWDVSSACRPDVIVTLSNFTRQRIKKFWGRSSVVIPPPVNINIDVKVKSSDSAYYIYAGELVAYKRVDLVIEAFNDNGKELVIAGDGEEFDRLKSMAKDNVSFAGRLDNKQFFELIAGAKALVFPGVEDFGLIPVEAMCLQTPVIAFSRGGVLDSVEDGKTGLFFDEQTTESINKAVSRFENIDLKISDECSKGVHNQFSAERFKTQLKELLNSI